MTTAEERVQRLNQWTKALRTTALGQAQGTLFETEEECDEGAIVKACCLGIAITVIDPDNVRSYVGSDLDETVPTWLDCFNDAGDVPLAWPEDYLRPRDTENTPISAAWLNDNAHCTFGQIADLLDYFGLEPREEGS